MFGFWLAAVLLVLAALVLLLPPLLRAGTGAAGRRAIERELAQLRQRHQAGDIDEPAYAGQRQRLGAALADAIADEAPAPARGLAFALAFGVPLATLALYLALGRVDALAPGPAPAAPAAGAGAGAGAIDMEAAIASLEARLAQDPDDVEGWLLLARSYRATEQFAQMQRATASALALAPGSPEVLVEHAEATTLNSPERRFTGPARDLLEQALATDPNQQKALWLLGISELQAGRPAEAVAWWQRLRALLPDGDPVAQRVDQQIAQARTQAGRAAAPMAAPSATGDGDSAAAAAGAGANTEATQAQAAAPQLLVTVTLAPTLQDRIGAGDTLFVFVRAPGGGPPLAIRRIDAPSFPVSVTLGPADRMLAGVQMSTGAEVVVGARVSRSGQAQAQSGDLESEPATLTLAASGTLALAIDRAREP